MNSTNYYIINKCIEFINEKKEFSLYEISESLDKDRLYSVCIRNVISKSYSHGYLEKTNQSIHLVCIKNNKWYTQKTDKSIHSKRRYQNYRLVGKIPLMEIPEKVYKDIKPYYIEVLIGDLKGEVCVHNKKVIIALNKKTKDIAKRKLFYEKINALVYIERIKIKTKLDGNTINYKVKCT